MSVESFAGTEAKYGLRQPLAVGVDEWGCRSGHEELALGRHKYFFGIYQSCRPPIQRQKLHKGVRRTTLDISESLTFARLFAAFGFCLSTRDDWLDIERYFTLAF